MSDVRAIEHSDMDCDNCGNRMTMGRLVRREYIGKRVLYVHKECPKFTCICGDRAAGCVCEQPDGHEGHHKCSHCLGAWSWKPDGEFMVHRLPSLDNIREPVLLQVWYDTGSHELRIFG